MRQRKYRIYDKINKRMIYDPAVFFFGDAWVWQERYGSKTRMAHEGELMDVVSLTDVNGKEIYEGDILGLNDPKDSSWVIVEFKEAAFRLNIKSCGIYSLDWSDLIVIGNIYENPELLKEHNEQSQST
jgi:hypothetical protein